MYTPRNYGVRLEARPGPIATDCIIHILDLLNQTVYFVCNLICKYLTTTTIILNSSLKKTPLNLHKKNDPKQYTIYFYKTSQKHNTTPHQKGITYVFLDS